MFYILYKTSESITSVLPPWFPPEGDGIYAGPDSLLEPALS